MKTNDFVNDSDSNRMGIGSFFICTISYITGRKRFLKTTSWWWPILIITGGREMFMQREMVHKLPIQIRRLEVTLRPFEWTSNGRSVGIKNMNIWVETIVLTWVLEYWTSVSRNLGSSHSRENNSLQIAAANSLSPQINPYKEKDGQSVPFVLELRFSGWKLGRNENEKWKIWIAYLIISIHGGSELVV